MNPEITLVTESERNQSWGKCICGGIYLLTHSENGEPQLLHSIPFCKRYTGIVTVEQAVNFSQANRGCS